MADLVGERYEPLAVVARGQEGEVLRARDHLGGRQVALQVRHLVSPFEMGALVTEALALLDVVRHPNLPLVREHFLLDDSYYLVMEWIEGVSLARVLRAEGAPGLALGRVVDHLVPVAAALEHLHTQTTPVVHGKVRPANLVLTADGRVALVGFGVSAGWGLGGPGLDEPPTPASDVHGLAVTAHTLLTGAPPGPGTVARFPGLSDAEAEGVLRALRRGFDPDPARRPPSPAALLEEIRAGASTLMLPVDVPPAEREIEPVWADFALEEAEADTGAQADTEVDDRIEARAADGADEIEAEAALWASLWAEPRPEVGAQAPAEPDVGDEIEDEIGDAPDVQAEMEAALLGALWAQLDFESELQTDAEPMVFSGVLVDAWSEAEIEVIDEPDVEDEPWSEAEIEVVDEPDVEDEAPEAVMPVAVGVEAEPDRMARVARSRRLRGVLAAVLVVLVGVTLLQVRSARAERNQLRRLQLASVARALATRVDGEVAAGRHERAALLARQADLFHRQSGQSGAREIDRALRAVLSAPHFSRVVATAEDGVWSVALSPDGSRLAVAGSSVRLVDPRSPQAKPVSLSGHLGAIAAAAFSPDGKTLATGGADPTVRLWDVAAPGAAPVRLEGHTEGVLSLAFGFPGHRLATAGADGTVRLWDLGTTPPSASVLSGHAGAVTAVAFSPDGARLASGGADGLVRIWDVAQPAAVATLPVGTTVGAVAYSPDGRYVATGSRDGVVRLWDQSQPQVPPRLLTGHGGPVSALAFSADGTTLASGSEDHTVRLWAPAGEPVAVLPGHGGPIPSLAFGPGGNTLVTASADGTARLWQLGETDAAKALRADPDLDRTTLSNLVCSEVGRNLTAGEWREFVGPGVAYRPTCQGLPRR